MELIFIWFLFGLVSAIVMTNKGLSGCTGWVLGILLGPFGLIIALVMKGDQQAIDANAVRQGDVRKCPECAELIKREARRCRFCGASVEPAR